jgi:hypothetical protein
LTQLLAVQDKMKKSTQKNLVKPLNLANHLEAVKGYINEVLLSLINEDQQHKQVTQNNCNHRMQLTDINC